MIPNDHKTILIYYYYHTLNVLKSLKHKKSGNTAISSILQSLYTGCCIKSGPYEFNMEKQYILASCLQIILGKNVSHKDAEHKVCFYISFKFLFCVYSNCMTKILKLTKLHFNSTYNGVITT